MTAQEKWAATVAALGPARRPVLTIRRRACGCTVGLVLRTRDAGYVVAGERRNLVAVSATQTRTARAWYLQLLEGPSQPEQWQCRHGQGFLPLDELLQAARNTTRPGGTFLVA